MQTNDRLSSYKRSNVIVAGQYFDTVVFESDAAANNFLHENLEYGVIKLVDNNVHVARNDD